LYLQYLPAAWPIGFMRHFYGDCVITSHDLGSIPIFVVPRCYIVE